LVTSDIARSASGEGRELGLSSDMMVTGFGLKRVEASVRRRENDLFVGGSEI